MLSTNFSSPFPADLISTHAQLDNNHLAPVTCYYIILFTDKKLVQNKTTSFNDVVEYFDKYSSLICRTKQLNTITYLIWQDTISI